jgi:antitoxin (DNA-binding transcriptional repressor) of toxin-antitoxin stability system
MAQLEPERVKLEIKTRLRQAQALGYKVRLSLGPEDVVQDSSQGRWTSYGEARQPDPKLLYYVHRRTLYEVMMANVIQVGAKEFREELAHYLDAGQTVAITRHGRTIGYYIPTAASTSEAEVAALAKAMDELQALLAEKGLTEEEIVGEFKRRRRSQS